MKRIFLTFIIALMLPAITSALTINSYHGTSDMSESIVKDSIEIQLNQNETNPITFTLPPQLTDTTVTLDDKLFSCNTEPKKDKTLFTCELPIGQHTLHIRYTTPYPLITLQDKLLFRTAIALPAPAEDFAYQVKLPLGYVIPSDKSTAFFVNPDPRLTYSDGQRIILVWKNQNQNLFEISVLSKPLVKSKAWLYGALILATLIIIALARYSFVLRKKTKEIVIPELIDAEQIVVDILKKAKNHELWQKQIGVTAKLSKVKLSRVIRNLEQRGVIKKEPWGNTNKITLIISQEKEKNK